MSFFSYILPFVLLAFVSVLSEVGRSFSNQPFVFHVHFLIAPFINFSRIIFFVRFLFYICFSSLFMHFLLLLSMFIAAAILFFFLSFRILSCYSYYFLTIFFFSLIFSFFPSSFSFTLIFLFFVIHTSISTSSIISFFILFIFSGFLFIYSCLIFSRTLSFSHRLSSDSPLIIFF